MWGDGISLSMRSWPQKEDIKMKEKIFPYTEVGLIKLEERYGYGVVLYRNGKEGEKNVRHLSHVINTTFKDGNFSFDIMGATMEIPLKNYKELDEILHEEARRIARGVAKLCEIPFIDTAPTI